ncbi:hypothetical protein EXIGLDRAFT_701978 [Exidia glandulosa HHB12029]|uniref:Ricin B lectin domain-containing protein n=1 Tax=Exidia glandulosa HHB12029 TaxID=1314781 RepID=A0A165CT20_EXIGL|nr:hypothetical protein EXIGLDRAFT_701978 [Exidia glandulosa HHB12029]
MVHSIVFVFILAFALDAAAAAIIPGAQYFIHNLANNGSLAVNVGFASLLEANPENVATQWIAHRDVELGSYRLFSAALDKEVTLDNVSRVSWLKRLGWQIKTPNEDSVWTLTGHAQSICQWRIRVLFPVAGSWGVYS